MIASAQSAQNNAAAVREASGYHTIHADEIPIGIRASPGCCHRDGNGAELHRELVRGTRTQQYQETKSRKLRLGARGARPD